MNRSNGKENLNSLGIAGFYATVEPITYAITRVVFGWIMIMHGWPKWWVGVEAVGNAFANNYGLPRWFAGLAIFFELVGGAALVLGLFTRFFASALAIELLIAMFAARWEKGFSIGTGGYEYVMFLGVVCFMIAIRGGGQYSVDARLPKTL